MSIMESVSSKLQEAMKSRDPARTSALRMIRAALIEVSKSGKGPLTDEMALQAIGRVKKQRAEAAEEYEKAGRADLAASERAELLIADEFLPRLADEETTRTWVKDAILASGAVSKREIGKVMGALMKVHKADIDAGVARRLAEQELHD